MNGDKIKTFMTLAGQRQTGELHGATAEQRELGAQLLLSEVLEYVIHGLGVRPSIDGTVIEHPDELQYCAAEGKVNRLEMIDGLADTAYTMFWNALAFGIPLEESFELVCDNNLEKFVALDDWPHGAGPLEREEWHCDCEVEWPESVVQVEVIELTGPVRHFAVGKDARGKVRKPSHYRPVDLSTLLPADSRK